MNIEAVKSALISLAIRGKLVPQRDNEPAVKQLGEAPKEAPFEIPAKWKWVRLDVIACLHNGRAYKKEELLEDNARDRTPVLRVGNFFTSNNWYFSDLTLEEDKYCDAGDLLYAWSASFGPRIWEGPRCIYHYHIWKITFEHAVVTKQWLFYWLEAVTQKLKESSHGAVMPHITKADTEKRWVPLPPLAEQRRIVAELEELLEPLSRVQERLGNLTHDFPEQFKAAVLQKAIQGKLVPQRDDEPAVEQIGEAPEEAPFEIPVKWKWVKLPEILFFQEGPGILAVDFKPEGVPLIRLAGVQGKYVTHAGCNFLDPQKVAAKWNHFKTELNDVVISSSASLDRVAVIGKDTVGNILYTGLIRFHPLAKGIKANIDMRWFIYFTQSQAFIDQINAKKTGATIKHFGPTHLKKMIIPLPPLAEQRRIVAKVEQLFSQVDELTARLSS